MVFKSGQRPALAIPLHPHVEYGEYGEHRALQP
jgi:hypothetical protein